MDKQRAIANAVTGVKDAFLEEALTPGEPKKRILFRPILSAAACLALILGLTFLWPRPLKVTVDGKNILTASVTRDGPEIMVMRAIPTVDVPMTVDPGRGGAVTVTAGAGSLLEAEDREAEAMTLTEKTGLTWLLFPGEAAEYSLTVVQGENQYLLRAAVDSTGGVTIWQDE